MDLHDIDYGRRGMHPVLVFGMRASGRRAQHDDGRYGQQANEHTSEKGERKEGSHHGSGRRVRQRVGQAYGPVCVGNLPGPTCSGWWTSVGRTPQNYWSGTSLAERQCGLLDGFTHWHDPIKAGGVQQANQRRAIARHGHVSVVLPGTSDTTDERT